MEKSSTTNLSYYKTHIYKGIKIYEVGGYFFTEIISKRSYNNIIEVMRSISSYQKHHSNSPKY